MGFLLRIAFWFSLVLLVLPFGGGADGEAQEHVGPIETFIAAKDALADLSGLCERKPEVCEVGRAAMNTVGVRAREAARVAYEMLDENFGQTRQVDQRGRTDQTVMTGGIEKIIEDTDKLSVEPSQP